MSELACEVVKMTTGIFARTGSVLTSANTARPSFRGKFRSRTMRPGVGASLYFPRRRRKEMASSPSWTALRWICHLLLDNTSLVRSMSARLSSTSKTSASELLNEINLLKFLTGWNRELESGSSPRPGFDPDPAAVLFDDFLADCQADSAAWVLCTGVQSFEDHENDLRLLRGNANAIVRDREKPFPGDRLRRH